MLNNARVQLALIAILMIVGIYFMQNHPTAPAVNAPVNEKKAITLDTTPQVALREVASNEATKPRAEEKIQSVIWTPEVKLVDEIIKSKNDNDPRMDTELKVLSEEAKTALRSYYLSRPEEDRNGKGTVIFLLGRNLKTEDDVKFMADALKEAPCRSLENCSSEATVIDHRESQHDTSPEVTLAYPKVMALSMLEKELSQPNLTPQMRQSIVAVIKESLNSEEPAVSKRAAAIIKRTQKR